MKGNGEVKGMSQAGLKIMYTPDEPRPWAIMELDLTGVEDTAPKITVEHLVETVNQTIQEGKRGAVGMIKALGRIEHHKKQLENSLSDVIMMYFAALKSRKMNESDVQRAMLRSMPSKALKMYAAAYFDVDEYIFPDDSETVITRLLEALQNEVEGEESDNTGETADVILEHSEV